jgi:hypothetical protein
MRSVRHCVMLTLFAPFIQGHDCCPDCRNSSTYTVHFNGRLKAKCGVPACAEPLMRKHARISLHIAYIEPS